MRSARLCALLLLLLPVLTHAASFDCTLAKSPRERAVCSNSTLSRKDARLELAYTRLRSELSPAGAAAVQQDQRNWLQWLERTCPAGIQSPPGATLASCLSDAYDDRLAELASPRRLPGGRLLYTRAAFGFAPEASRNPRVSNNMDPGFGTRTASYPQIDGSDAYAGTFNRAAVSAALALTWVDDKHAADFVQQVDPGSGEDITYSVVGSNPQELIIVFEDLTMMHPGAHPSTTRATFAWLPAQGRPLQIDDVFQPDSRWKEALVAPAAAKLQSNADLKFYLRPGSELTKGVAEGVGMPTSWIVARDGLHIRFAQYQVAAYVAGMPEIILPWQELQPYLNPELQTTKLPPCTKD